MIFALLLLLSVCLRLCPHAVDPSDFFTGARQKPKLEIMYPENGAILDSSDLDVKIQLSGFKFPSLFHDSAVCIGLSFGETFTEECFVDAPDFTFRVTGLFVDTAYSLRVAFFERGEAIAVSVRNFRVAGVKGIMEDNRERIVSIQTAVQVALTLQLSGRHSEAELIYRSILSVNPLHANTLHLLGINFYQTGDVAAAIPYIQKAISFESTFFESNPPPMETAAPVQFSSSTELPDAAAMTKDGRKDRDKDRVPIPSPTKYYVMEVDEEMILEHRLSLQEAGYDGYHNSLGKFN